MSTVRSWNVPNQNHKRVTLHDVARHVGVSKSTVSLVLQDSPNVSEKTRERVLRGIDEIGYVYNRKAAALRQSQQDGLIGVIVNGLNTPYSGEILNQLERVALAEGVVPMFASNGERLAQQEMLVRLYMEHKVAGFILCPAPGTTSLMLDKLWRNGFPLVQIMREVPFGQFPAVVADNRQGTYAATRHLIRLGHKYIAFVGGCEEISDYHERVAGYRDAMNEAGLSMPAGYIYPILQSRAAGRQALQAVLDYDPRISGVVCFSDLMAYGVLSMSRELGITVGRDLAVVGFDDLVDSRLTYPALTTVRVSTADFARSAMELLQLYIRNPQAPLERKVLPVTLVTRESCGMPQS
ncbi:MAG TPA: LacI family DNA-binding transcriptional regulator [Thiolinea sp.]|nr:LacI family DNA-binding transcriptional regulator [Thiolinea sp.]